MVALFAVMGLVGMQGGVMLYITVPVAKWFVRKRARAMALTFVGNAIGITIGAPLTQFMIDHLGWQNTWVLLGSGGAVVVAIVSLAVVRRQPEDMGLLPDGASPAAGAAAGAGPRTESSKSLPHSEESEPSWTRAEAIRTGAFWRLAVLFGLVTFGPLTMFVYRAPYFRERGIDSQLVALSISTSAIVGVPVLLLLGIFMDRYRVQYVGLVGVLILTGSILMTMAVTAPWQMFLSSVLFGLSLPILVLLQNTIWPAYFGRTNVGSIRGVAMPIALAIGAVGPPMTGIIRDSTGDYFLAWWVAIACLVVGASLIVLTPRPRPPKAAVAVQ